jgi:hypothetical protein
MAYGGSGGKDLLQKRLNRSDRTQGSHKGKVVTLVVNRVVN